MILLKMSIYGAVIILAILLIRAFTLHKLPKKTFLILWTVALVRLLIPFEISSGLSLYSLLPEVTGEISSLTGEEPYIPNPENPYEPFQNYADYLKNQGNTQIADDDVVIVEPTGGAIYLPKDNPEVEAIPLPDVDTDAGYTDGMVSGENMSASPAETFSAAIRLKLQSIWSSALPVLPGVWATGALLCAIFFLVSYLRCMREFRTSLPVTEDYAAEWLNQHPLKRTISIRQSDKISAPLTYGMFRPVILMPKKTEWNNVTRLDYVLYHEFTHIRRFDLAAKLVMIIALCVHWFNPLVWLMYFFFNRDLELSCDDCVVKHFKESKADYANTLIGMEEKKNYSTPLCNHFSKNAIEERITAIMQSKKTTIGMMIAAVVIIGTVVITLTTDRKETTETPENSGSDSSVIMEYKEVLTARVGEYLTMINSCFLSNPPISGEAVPEHSVSINNDTGFYPVDEEQFPSYDALIGYVKSICTEKYADELYRRYWLLEHYSNPHVLPNIGALNGKAYTKQFQSTPYPERFEITDIKENDEITLTVTFRFTEETNPYYWGVLTFIKQENLWYVADTTIHRHPMEVSPTPTTSPDDYPYDLPPWNDEEHEQEVTKQQLIDLFHSYRSMYSLLFHSGLECGMHTHLPDEEVTINGVGPYYKVLVEQFPTLESVIDYMETFCTPHFAKELREEYLHMDSDEPWLAELSGQLYTRYYSSSTWDEPVNFRFMNLSFSSENIATLDYEGYDNTPIDVRKRGTITFTLTQDGWRIASTTSGYGNPYFDAYDYSGEELQMIECTEPGFDSPTMCNDIIFYSAKDGDTIEDVLIAMKTAILEQLTIPSEDRTFTVTSYDVTVEQPYQQIGINAWRLPVLTGYYAFEGVDLVDFETMQQSAATDAEGRVPFLAQGSDEVFYFILLEQNGVYRLQREEAANAMLEDKLTYDTDWVYTGWLMTLPDTTSPDWYAAVEELQHGHTPADTIVAERSFHSNYGSLKSIRPSNENGHVFTISHLEYGKDGQQVLKDFSMDLSTYTTSLVWNENGIFYDAETDCIYVVFSPSDCEAEGGLGMADYQVLLATIPARNPAAYTIRCYGNPETSLRLGGSYTYGTAKIGNLIFLGESCHGDTFYTIDINTMGLNTLSYVNDALHAQAKSYLEQCGFGTEFASDYQVVCKTGNYTVFSAEISYSFDNSPAYFTVYHAYDGDKLAGKVILRHLIPFYDAINESHVNAMYITMDDVVLLAKEQFEAFYASKGYTQPYEITSIHMTCFDSMEVKFLLSESDNYEIYTEGTVNFTYDFASETWSVSSFREIPPDYLSSFLEFPEIAAEDVIVTGKDWCLTFLDETELPRFQELMTSGGTLISELIDSRFPEEGSQHTIYLDGIGYYFYSDSAPKNNHRAWNIYITSPDYPLSGGAKVGMTAEELLSLYPKLAKTSLSAEDPAFKGTYGSDHFAFRNDQFPESFLKEYEYAYVSYLDKGQDGLPVCIAFLISKGQIGAITVYMPTAG